MTVAVLPAPEDPVNKLIVLFPSIPDIIIAERTNRSPDRREALAYFDEIPPISLRDL
jgi:hypothetical protein